MRQAYDYWQDQPGNRRDLAIRNPRHRVAALTDGGTPTGSRALQELRGESLLLSHRGQRGRAWHPRPTDGVRQEQSRSTLVSGPAREGGPLSEEQGTRILPADLFRQSRTPFVRIDQPRTLLDRAFVPSSRGRARFKSLGESRFSFPTVARGAGPCTLGRRTGSVKSSRAARW